MKEEKNEKKYLEPIVGALIINKEEKILLVKGSKWGGKYVAPGGHVNYGEKLDDALKREIKEELSIEITIENELGFDESIFSADIEWTKKRHFVFLDYVCKFEGDEADIKLNEEHDGGYGWFAIEEAKNLDLAGETKSFIEKYEKYLKEKSALDGWKRCQADFENYKKDQGKRMEEFRKFASLDMVLQILPVLDNFEKSLEHVPEDQKESAWVKGVNLILKQLEDVLKNYGVEEIKAKEGDEFNPEIHEAVQSADIAEKADKADKISKVLQRGYKMDGKVIRAVRVIAN